MKNLILSLLFISFFSSCHSEQTVNELKQSVCIGLPQIIGWCSPEKALNFIDLVLEVKPQAYVEIGVFGGSSLFPVASTLKFLNQGVIYAIDPWNMTENLRHFDPALDPANFTWWKALNYDSIYNSYQKMLKRYEIQDYCITLKMTSEAAVTRIENIDILYIDGGHSEGAFLTDVSLYLPKVRSGGYIWMNDTLWEQAQLAIELLLEECEVIKLIDNGNCILFKKL